MTTDAKSPYIRSQHMEGNLFDLYAKVYEATTPEESLEIYRKWAPVYEQSEEQNGWTAPEMCANLLVRNLSNHQRKRFCILDIGAGTGLVGVALKKAARSRGINLSLYGLDRSSDMLDIARAKIGIYESLYTGDATKIDDDEGPLRKAMNAMFDGVTCVGAINPGHIPPETIWKFSQVVCPGGVIVFSIKDTFIKESRIEKIILEGEDLDTWRILERYYTESACKDDAHHHICLQVL